MGSFLVKIHAASLWPTVGVFLWICQSMSEQLFSRTADIYGGIIIIGIAVLE